MDQRMIGSMEWKRNEGGGIGGNVGRMKERKKKWRYKNW